MKRTIILLLIVASYVVFLWFLMSPGHNVHHAEGMDQLVIGHLTDHPIEKVNESASDNIIIKLVKKFDNSIYHLNETTLKHYKIKIGPLVGDMQITKWVMMMWLALFTCILIFIPLGRKIKKEPMGSKSLWVNFWEAVIGFVHDEIVEPNFHGKYIKKAMPYFLTLFFFIWFCNMLGLIPGMATATGNLAVTMGLALFTVLGMFVVGTIKQGPLWVITGIVPHGIPIFLFPLMWAIEFLGLLIKPFALMVRLFANMTAGHVVIIIFLYLVMMFQNYFIGIGSVAGSLMIYLLEVLVAAIQAYIFAALTAMFIGSSMEAH